jgi:hypothetical protein
MSEQLHRAIGGIEGKLDGIAEALAARNARDNAHDENVGKRLGRLEKRQAWYSGAAAAVGERQRHSAPCSRAARSDRPRPLVARGIMTETNLHRVE